MGTVVLTPEAVSDAGLVATNVTPLATTDTYTVDNSLPFLLHFKKSGAGNCNVVFTSPKVPGQRVAKSTTVQVPATTGDVFVGPFDPNQYNNTKDVKFTVSQITGLSVAVIKLPFTHRKR